MSFKRAQNHGTCRGALKKVACLSLCTAQLQDLGAERKEVTKEEEMAPIVNAYKIAFKITEKKGEEEQLKSQPFTRPQASGIGMQDRTS